ncbi:MAG: hypothetical protein K8I27_16165 [Planctomycetes bacterium]|nr:hypothetical protein [Planctomycetota bacterium]
MRKWKPLIASLLVIVAVIGGMAAWKYAGGNQPSRAGNNTGDAPDGPPANSSDGDGLTWVETELEDLPALDPLGLWPRDGQRIASAGFNVMWETTEYSPSRLLVSKERGLWYSMGRTSGTRHFLPLNFGDFDSTLEFAVEFESRGQRYRSNARRVSFGNGARFARREYRLTLDDEATQTFDIEISGRDPARMPQNAFLSGWFPEELGVGAVPGESRDNGGAMLLVVSSTEVVTGNTFGWFEMYDAAANTYDRALIFLGR